MVTILLEQIIEILKGWLSSFTSWAEGVAEKLGLIEEATEYIDDIYDDTTAIKDNTTSIADSNTRIQGYSLIISNKTSNIDSNVTTIKNNVGSIAASSGIAAAFSEDIATNTLNTLDKVTTIASDTTQLRADNAVVKSDLDKIYDALRWSLVGVDTTETEEGVGSLSFDTDKTDPLDQFVIAFEVVQSGSGDPAPDNVRTITGWTDFDINANGTTYNIDLDGTYYGGSVDCLTGEITANKAAIVIDGTQPITVAVQAYIKSDACDCFITVNDIYIRVSPTNQPDGFALCDKLLPVKQMMWNLTGYANTMTINQNQIHLNIANDLLGITDYTQETTASAKAKIQTYLQNNPITVVFITNASAQAQNTLSINTIKGLNTITSDSNGKMTVTYTESVKHYLDKQEG